MFWKNQRKSLCILFIPPAELPPLSTPTDSHPPKAPLMESQLVLHLGYHLRSLLPIQTKHPPPESITDDVNYKKAMVKFHIGGVCGGLTPKKTPRRSRSGADILDGAAILQRDLQKFITGDRVTNGVINLAT